MKKIVIILLLFLAVLAASKEVTARRAYGFILECTTEPEREIISAAMSKEEEREHYGMVLRAMACVQSKQSFIERAISNALGVNLFK